MRMAALKAATTADEGAAPDDPPAALVGDTSYMLSPDSALLLRAVGPHVARSLAPTLPLLPSSSSSSSSSLYRETA